MGHPAVAPIAAKVTPMGKSERRRIVAMSAVGGAASWLAVRFTEVQVFLNAATHGPMTPSPEDRVMDHLGFALLGVALGLAFGFVALKVIVPGRATDGDDGPDDAAGVDRPLSTARRLTVAAWLALAMAVVVLIYAAQFSTPLLTGAQIAGLGLASALVTGGLVYLGTQPKDV